MTNRRTYKLAFAATISLGAGFLVMTQAQGQSIEEVIEGIGGECMMLVKQLFCVPGANVPLDGCPTDCAHLVLPSGVPVEVERAVPYDGIGNGKLGPVSTLGMPATCRVMHFSCDSANTCLFNGLMCIAQYNQTLNGEVCNDSSNVPQ